MKILQRNSQDGFSMIGVLMLTGAGLLAILMISRSQVNLRAASKSLDSINSYHGFIGGFTDFLHASVKDNIDALCAGQTGPLNSLNFNGKPATFTTQIAGTATNMDGLNDRCRRPLLAADGRFYFCLRLNPNDAFANDSFGGAESNFTEVAVRTVNKWQQPISCLEYRNATDSDVALQIYYRLYWITKTQPDRLYQKYGYYYGIKE